MFTVGGRNVYPAEIENALAEHPDVLSCLVVGVPDPNAGDLGQVPHALVQAGSVLDARAVRAISCATVSRVTRCRATVEFVDTPLRDDAGKAVAQRCAPRSWRDCRLGRR